ncbi:MAG: gamma-glutamyl-phosphate reductase, partial [Pirellulaceae bacterium]|nr:gamma-glutamyl-phosphate reductase [Pirellulaceae bacterium]
MATAAQTELTEYCEATARAAKEASAALVRLTGDQKNKWLLASAAALRARAADIAAANQQDLEAAPGFGLTEAQIDRLRLTPERIEGIAVGLEEVAALPDPAGEVIESSRRPNGLEIAKVRVPLGV